MTPVPHSDTAHALDVYQFQPGSDRHAPVRIQLINDSGVLLATAEADWIRNPNGTWTPVIHKIVK